MFFDPVVDERRVERGLDPDDAAAVDIPLGQPGVGEIELIVLQSGVASDGHTQFIGALRVDQHSSRHESSQKGNWIQSPGVSARAS